MRLEESVELGSPASEVWDIVGNYANDERWRGEVIKASSVPAGPVQVGAEVLEVARFMGMTMRTPAVVAEVSGRSFRWRTRGGLKFTGQRRVDEVAPRRARVTLLMEGRFAGPMQPLRVLEPLIQTTMRRQVKANLARLRALVEVAPARLGE